MLVLGGYKSDKVSLDSCQRKSPMTYCMNAVAIMTPEPKNLANLDHIDMSISGCND
jgi:hypothetical protein